MSYSIFYRAMFIKMKDGSYIPMIESGDSNVWECDNRRRAREWCACRWTFETPEQRERYSLSEQEIMDAAQHDVDKHVQEYAGKEPAFGGQPYTKEAVLADLGFFNCIHISGHGTTSASRFLNFFKSGFRHAITMDDLEGGLSLFWYDNTNGGHHEYVKNEEELAEKWSEFQSKGVKPWITLSEGRAEYAWRGMKIRTDLSM